MINFFEETRKIQSKMVEYRRQLHKYPEVDRQLYKTADYVEAVLKENNISYTRYSNCGIVAEVGNGEKIVALRADMDALTIEDKKETEYRSRNIGIMHACGHDAHTAIQLGAAIVLKKFENQINGKVRLIFQPAEETDGGAKDMIEYGALEGVSFISGLHVDETLETGVVGVKKGVVNAASNPFEIIIKGKGAHGAHPEDGIDSIVIAAKIIDNLQPIISREISPVNSGLITIGTINGGTAQNSIAESVKITGIIRTLGDSTREFVIKRFVDIVENTAKMYRATVNINIIESYPSFHNDNYLVDCLIDIYNTDNHNKYFILKELEYPSMGVEDFAYYTKVIPGIYYRLGCRNESKGIIHPAHASYFDVDEECLWIGSGIQCNIALKMLENIK